MLLPVGSNPTEKASDTASDTQKCSQSTTGLLGSYRNLTILKNEQRWAAMNIRNRDLLTEPVSLLCGAWSRDDVFSFGHALIHIAARWKEIAPAAIPCPIHFTDAELQLYNSELETLEGLREVLHQFQDDNLIPLGGMVFRENYEQASRVNHAVKEMLMDMAEPEAQRALYSRIWPYQEQES